MSVVVPTRDEAGTIAEVVDRLHSALAGHVHETFVVDDFAEPAAAFAAFAERSARL